MMTCYNFRCKMGYSCHIKNPQTFNEKIQYLKIYKYSNNPLVTKCADKFEVRNFIRDKGYGDLLVPLFGHWDSANDIDFDKLPDKFVLKCNHGSGYNILCNNKNKINRSEVIMTLDKWMKEDFSVKFAELQYRNIPHKIIAEQYLGEEIYDYKFFCFNGKPKYIYISQEIPETNGEVKCCFWDENGNLAEFERTDEHFYKKDEVPSIPTEFSEMKQIASDLSSGFPFVRVDLFLINDKIYFSELTFTPAAGMMPLRPTIWDRKLGDLLILQKNKLMANDKN